MPLLKFDDTRHPRGHQGRFVTARGMQAIMNAQPAVRYHTGPSLGAPRLAEASPGPGLPERRSATRGELWQRIGSRIAELPASYTGQKQMERPVGSYLHLTIDNQIPKAVPQEDHHKRVKRFIQMAKDKRQEIFEGAAKSRVGKKHVYLKAAEPASGGVDRWRMKPDKYPDGTAPATLHRAYNHAALLAMHDRGLVRYDFKMDDALKDELKPTEPFIRYARQRLNIEANIHMPGERAPYLDSYGETWIDQHGRPRRRFKPNQQLIKRAGNLKAAGLMLLSGPSHAKKVLLLKRASGGDHQGEWCFPGGKIEDGETPRQAAIRETQEEIGPVVHGRPVMWARRVADGVDFTTFAARVPNTYRPVLNEEHTAWTWARPDKLPAPMHPGCAVSLDRLLAERGAMAKRSPFGAVRQMVTSGLDRAATALDGLSAPREAQEDAAAQASAAASRVGRMFRPRQPGAANRSGYTLGRWAAGGLRSFAKNPVKTVKAGIVEGAHAGAGVGQGLSDGFGGGPRTRRWAGRVGAVAGAAKVPVLAGLAGEGVYHELGGGKKNAQPVQKMQKFDPVARLRRLKARRDPLNIEEFAENANSSPVFVKRRHGLAVRHSG